MRWAGQGVRQGFREEKNLHSETSSEAENVMVSGLEGPGMGTFSLPLPSPLLHPGPVLFPPPSSVPQSFKRLSALKRQDRTVTVTVRWDHHAGGAR